MAVRLAISGCVLILVAASCMSAPLPLAPSPTTQIEPTAAGSPDWASLETNLQLPVVASGAACPRSTGRVVSPAFGAGLGDGPVYPVGLATTGTLGVVADPNGFIQKVLWVASAAYPGPVLIRGGRLGATGVVQFGSGGSLPVDEFRLTEATAGSPGEEPGWREWPSYTYVPALGCYAYQIDGVGFTKIVVFEAIRSQ
jgi:hypothetical protein